MKTYQVDVVINPWDEEGFLAEAPALQGCWVVAPTVTKAMEQIVEVVQMHLDATLEQRQGLPEGVLESSKQTVKVKVAVSAPAGQLSC